MGGGVAADVSSRSRSNLRTTAGATSACPALEGGAVTYKAFLGYSSRPELARDALHRASELISQTGITARSWEDLAIGGQIIISTVLSAIDDSDVSIFDVSTLSPNVLYELGYAIGRAQHIWLLIDKSDAAAATRWERFRLLSSVGYRGWTSSEEIRNLYLVDQPHLAESTVYDQLIEPTLVDEPRGAAIFYMPMTYDTDANIAADRRLAIEAGQGIRLITADPNECRLSFPAGTLKIESTWGVCDN